MVCLHLTREESWLWLDSVWRIFSWYLFMVPPARLLMPPQEYTSAIVCSSGGKMNDDRIPIRCLSVFMVFLSLLCSWNILFSVELVTADATAAKACSCGKVTFAVLFLNSGGECPKSCRCPWMTIVTYSWCGDWPHPLSLKSFALSVKKIDQ